MHEGVLLAYIGACLQIIKTMTRSCGVVSAWTSTFRARPPWRPPALWPGRRATRLTHTAGLRPGTAGSRFPPALAAATVRVTITAGVLAFQAHLKRKRCVCPRESRAREQTAESCAGCDVQRAQRCAPAAAAPAAGGLEQTAEARTFARRIPRSRREALARCSRKRAGEANTEKGPEGRRDRMGCVL